jgi:hypothetical protein
MSNPNLYLDLLPILETALRAGGARVQLRTLSEARHWRHRAYRYREALLQQARAATPVPGWTPTTPFDSMTISIDQTTNEVIIKFRSSNYEMRTLDGRPLPPHTPTVGHPSIPSTPYEFTDREVLDALRGFSTDTIEAAEGTDLPPFSNSGGSDDT